MIIANQSYTIDLEEIDEGVECKITLDDDALRNRIFEYCFCRGEQILEQTTIWSAHYVSYDISKMSSDLGITAAALKSSNSNSLTVIFFKGTTATLKNDKYRIVASDEDNYLGEIIFRDSRYSCIYGQKKSYRSYMCLVNNIAAASPSVVFVEKNGLVYMKDRINRLLLN